MSGAVTAAVVGGVIAGGAGIAGSAIQSSAAGKAADAQATAAQNAAAYQKQASQQALDYQQNLYGQTQQNLSPWMQSGQQANSKLQGLLGLGGQPQSNVAPQTNTPYQPNAQTGNTSTLTNPTTGLPAGGSATPQSGVQQAGQFSFDPTTGQATAQPGQASTGGMIQGGQAQQTMAPGGAAPGASAASGVDGYGSLLTPYQDFSAPTGLNYQNDPGYQARLQLGTDTLQHSAAARGNLLTGGTAKALDTYAQDYASNEYGNVYNRALQGYQTNQGNYYTGQNNAYSRLMGLSTQGQQTAETLGQLGQQNANNAGNVIMGGAGAYNQQMNNAAQATASGYLNQGQAWGQGIASAGNNFGNLYAAAHTPKYGGNSPYVLPDLGYGIATATPNPTVSPYEQDYTKNYG